MSLLKSLGRSSKRGIISTAIKALETMNNERTLEQDISAKIGKVVMDDEEVGFLIRTFKSKFDLPMRNVGIRPAVSEDTYTVTHWELRVDKVPVIEGKSPQDITDQMTEYMLTKDVDKVRELIVKLNGVTGRA